MELNALATAATENDPRGANQSSGGVSKPPKEKGESDNKKRTKSQAFKADKLVQILLEYEAIENVEDVGGLRKYIEECDHVSRSPHVDLWFDPPFD